MNLKSSQTLDKREFTQNAADLKSVCASIDKKEYSTYIHIASTVSSWPSFEYRDAVAVLALGKIISNILSLM